MSRPMSVANAMRADRPRDVARLGFCRLPIMLTPSARGSVRQSLRLLQHCDGLLHREQRRGLGRAKCAARGDSNGERRRRRIGWSFDQHEPVVLTETIPEAVQLSSEFLDDGSSHVAPILRLPDEASPGFRGIAETHEIVGHEPSGCTRILCTGRARPPVPNGCHIALIRLKVPGARPGREPLEAARRPIDASILYGTKCPATGGEPDEE